MRQNTSINHENEHIIYHLMYQMRAKLDPLTSCKFIGVLLVLKKYGLLSPNLNNYHMFFENIKPSGMTEGLFSIFQETITEVQRAISTESLRILGLIDSEFSDYEYLYWYDYLINVLANKQNSHIASYAPKEFGLLTDLFLPTKTKKIFNPFGGIMRLAIEINNYQIMDACEVKHSIWVIGMLRIALAGKESQISFNNINVDSWTSNIYDAIVAMPPFNAKIRMHHSSTFSANTKSEEIELIAPTRFIENTGEDGCCITFVSPSIMWSSGEKARFREWATKNRFIDTIILLPKNLLSSTTIPVVLIVLRKKSYHKDGVRMIDASDYFTNLNYKNFIEISDVMEAYHHDIENISATIPFKEIEDNDYSWNIADYFHRAEIKCPEGYTISRIEDIITFPQVNKSTDRHSAVVIHINNLSDDWTRPLIDTNALEKNMPIYGFTVLTEDAVLLSTFNKLRPSIVKASIENPVFISSNILAVIPNDNIDAEYLCMILSKTDIPIIGFGSHHLSKTRLLRQLISYPSIEQQRATYQEARNAAMLEKIKTHHLEEIFNQLKADYINEVRARKHDMKTPMTQLRNSLTLIKELVNELPEEFACRLDKYVSRQQKAMDVLSNIVSHIADEEVFANPEIVDIESVLKSFETVNNKYIIEYHRDNISLEEAEIDTPYLKIGKMDFIRLSQNIISNAIYRGFIKDNAEYSLNITLSVENEFFVIVFSNNGEPLPDGMDKVRYGTKGTKGVNSDGSGTGGYIVKSITQHYGGDFDIFSSKFANMNVTNIIVKLPIYRKEDE